MSPDPRKHNTPSPLHHESHFHSHLHHELASPTPPPPPLNKDFASLLSKPTHLNTPLPTSILRSPTPPSTPEECRAYLTALHSQASDTSLPEDLQYELRTASAVYLRSLGDPTTLSILEVPCPDGLTAFIVVRPKDAPQVQRLLDLHSPNTHPFVIEKTLRDLGFPYSFLFFEPSPDNSPITVGLICGICRSYTCRLRFQYPLYIPQ